MFKKNVKHIIIIKEISIPISRGEASKCIKKKQQSYDEGILGHGIHCLQLCVQYHQKLLRRRYVLQIPRYPCNPDYRAHHNGPQIRSHHLVPHDDLHLRNFRERRTDC